MRTASAFSRLVVTWRARRRLARNVRSRSIPIDVEAADEVKRLRLP